MDKHLFRGEYDKRGIFLREHPFPVVIPTINKKKIIFYSYRNLKQKSFFTYSTLHYPKDVRENRNHK